MVAGAVKGFGQLIRQLGHLGKLSKGDDTELEKSRQGG